MRGVNLLELGFPLFNGEEFARHGLRLKAEPYRVLYDYVYAAGLSVAGSEEACLELLAFAMDAGLSLGAHYCSMENKHAGQVFQQNAPHAARYSLRAMSPRDHLLKSCKAFGADREPVRGALAAGGAPLEENDGFDFIEFRPAMRPSCAGSCPTPKSLSATPSASPATASGFCASCASLRPPATFDFERDW